MLLDRTMPSMSGDRVFNEIRRIQPEARIILVSGYSEEQAAEGFAGGALAGFLQKPFLPTELIALVGQHLRDQGQRGRR